ncbi:MAG TPA: NAD(P)H-dependent oxidoreductase, partial [Kribbella sp.]|nr:NAD(P)H-dependent oxidoreductase [Kribbella sp.]
NISSIAAPTGGADAHASLAKVLGYLNAVVVEAACSRVPMSRKAVGADGLVTDPAVRAGITAAVDALHQAAHSPAP